MDWRDQIAKEISVAQVFDGGEYFRDGKYDNLILKKLILHQGHEGNSLVSEWLVTSAVAIEPGVTPNAVGSTASTAFNFTKHKGVAHSNAKKLALALAGMTLDELAAEQDAENAEAAAKGRPANDLFQQWLLKATNEDPKRGAVQPLRGRMVNVSTYRQRSKNQPSSTPRAEWKTYPKFEHVPNQASEVVAANRARLDATAPLGAPAPEYAAPPAAPPAPALPPAPPAPVVPPPLPPAPAPTGVGTSPAPAATPPAPAAGFLSRLGL